MIYTPKQRELMRLWQKNELRRLNVLEGSVSSGKTWISLVLWAFWVATMPEDKLYLMSGKSLTTLKRNCLLPLEELVGASNFSFSLPAKEGYLFGRHILLEGASDARSESKIRGLTLQGAYCDELTLFPQDFFAMLLSRLRVPGAKLIATTNPDSPQHWLKTGYLDRPDELDLLDVKFLLDDNTKLDPQYVEALKAEYTGVFYERFVLGRWVLAQGRVYDNFCDRNLTDDIGEGIKYITCDYGTQNATVFLLWGKSGNRWICEREYYYSGREARRQKTDEAFADDLEAFSQGERIRAVIVDPSAASFSAALMERRIPVQKADNEVLSGIRHTASCLDRGIIAINRRCLHTIEEFGVYAWDEKAGEDKPLKESDHCMDAVRYFVSTVLGRTVGGGRRPKGV